MQAYNRVTTINIIILNSSNSLEKQNAPNKSNNGINLSLTQGFLTLKFF